MPKKRKSERGKSGFDLEFAVIEPIVIKQENLRIQRPTLFPISKENLFCQNMEPPFAT